MKYRKKPVVIEAIQLNSKLDNMKQCYDFCQGKAEMLPFGLKIETLEGVHMASDFDFIIKGVKGEFYPCKPDIFEMTYEKIEEIEDCYKLGKELSHEDMFRLLKHNQRAAEINLNEYSKSKKEIAEKDARVAALEAELLMAFPMIKFLPDYVIKFPLAAKLAEKTKEDE